MKALVNILISAVAVLVASKVLPGVSVDSFLTAVVVSVLLGLANSVVAPALLVLTLPINILTLGLFTFVIIGGLVMLIAHFVPGFYIVSFWWALAFAFVCSFVNGFLHAATRA